MTPEEYFEFHQSISKKRYDALHDYYVNKQPAAEMAKKHGYQLSTFIR